MGLGLHGSGIMPIILLIAAVLGGAYYLGRQWFQRRRTQNSTGSRGQRP
jgi:hypothetical protein